MTTLTFNLTELKKPRDIAITTDLDAGDNAAKWLYVDNADGNQAEKLALSTLESRYTGGGASLTIDTAANIIASAPASPSMAFSTDTHLFYVWDGSDWYVSDSVWSLIAAGLAGQWDFSNEVNSGLFVLWAFN